MSTTGTSTDQARTFTAPPRNMVQEVRNIIEGYSMGPLRALAQEPVQNSLDARRPGADKVFVQYRLCRRATPEGGQVTLLVVTDSGTTGLRGEPLSPEDLHARGQLQLRPEENWAAWEAMGYTKVGEDALGSRGQGKAAFLYQSRHNSPILGDDGRPLQRMIILYDTLLEDGTYRLGVRLARPDDVILYPPYEGDEARAVIETAWEGNGIVVPLGLEPLAEVGTRIIVPFLSTGTFEAFANGEIVRWLERCWWRAIQTESVSITVVDAEDRTTEVGVPTWWVDEPWLKDDLPANVFVEENIPLELESTRRIKRLVLIHEDDLGFDEIDAAPLQYSGIQLLRGRQWIETQTASEKFGDFILPDKRDGFRGFVEFDRYLDRELREVERPQHDGFRRHRVFVGKIDSVIKDAVREFARTQGWIQDADSQPAPETNGSADRMLDRVTDLFVAEGVRGTRGGPGAWTCTLSMEFPHSTTARVNWEEEIRDISIECSHEPAHERKDVEIVLELVRPDGTVDELARRGRKTSNGTAGADLGGLKVVHTSHAASELGCPVPDRYRLRARCLFEDRIVAASSRAFYVELDPPTPETRPFGITLNVGNASAERVRINSGELLELEATIVNRTADDRTLSLDLTLGDLVVADASSTQLTIEGRPAGDVPAEESLDYQVQLFVEPAGDNPTGRYVVLDAGTHYVRADLCDETGSVVAHASRRIYFEVDPPGGADTPFDVVAREDGVPYPIWELDPPASEGGRWILRYALRHPTFETAANGGQDSIDRFWAATFSEALVEWALRLDQSQGDADGFKLLTAAANTDGNPLWERYENKIQALVTSYNDPISCLTLQREVVSLMICLLEEA